MNLSIGIVGLANVGKSTLFNALRSSQGKLLQGEGAKTANYPFTTIEPNVGVVAVPDERLEKLARVIAEGDSIASSLAKASDDKSLQNDERRKQNDKRGWVDGLPPIIPAVVRFVDIAGLVRGAYKGEGLGNQFLAHIREVDVIVFVLRGFSDEHVIKTGKNPKEDLEVIKSELLLKDLETIAKNYESLNHELRSAVSNDPRRLKFEVLTRAKGMIEQGKWIGDELSDEELAKISDFQLLSSKKAIVVVNSDEEDLTAKENPLQKDSIRICAKLEEELAELSEDEQKQYLKELGIEKPGLEKLIKKAYETLGLATFLTAGPKEVRVWTIKRGTLASQAAGVIHTDFERGFIAADIVSFDKFVDVGGWQAAREKGAVKTIGRGEVMPEGMVVEFKFSI